MSAAFAEAPPLNPVIAIVRTPLALAQLIAFTMFGDSPDELIVMRTSPGLARDDKLVAENLVVADVVGDRGDQFDRR